MEWGRARLGGVECGAAWRGAGGEWGGVAAALLASESAAGVRCSTNS